jgi:predicted kinase
MSTTLLMFRGLQASGKSTAAKELVEQGWKRVNKDDFRAMVDSGKWSKKNEEAIKQLEVDAASTLLTLGYNVVVDDTNFAYEDMWKGVAKACGSTFEIRDFTTPVNECVRRNLLRGETVPTDAIWKLHRQYIQPSIKKPAYDVSLPDAFIFDIDGTLAHMKDRSPFDWERVGEDSLDENVAHILDALREAGRTIIIVSGRDGCSQMDTEKWLDKNDIKYDHIYFRKNKDVRADNLVKGEIYENNIKGKYNVLGVFDDRDSVVELWRSLGLKRYQCEYGNF